MEKEFIPYELALELKELGFDEPCLGHYYTLDGEQWKFATERHLEFIDALDEIGKDFIVDAPTYAQAFRWFREKYQLHFSIMV